MKIIFVLTALLCGSSAFAYIPPVDFILNRMLQNRDQIKTIEMTGKITDFRTHATFTEVLRLDFSSGRFSASYSTPETESGGTHSSSLKNLHPLGMAWIEMGIDSSSARVRAALAELKVMPNEKTEVRISRIGTRPVWAWGDFNRIQIAKDEFVIASYSSSSGLELLVQESTPAIAEMRLPKILRFRKSGQDFFLYELKGYKLNPQSAAAVKTGEVIASEAVREWVDLVR